MEFGFIVTIFLIGFVGSYISAFLIDPLLHVLLNVWF